MSKNIQFFGARNNYDDDLAYQRYMNYLRTQSTLSRDKDRALIDLEAGIVPPAEQKTNNELVIEETQVEGLINQYLNQLGIMDNPRPPRIIGEEGETEDYLKKYKPFTYIKRRLNQEPNIKNLFLRNFQSIKQGLGEIKFTDLDQLYSYIRDYALAYQSTGGVKGLFNITQPMIENISRQIRGDFEAVVGQLPQRDDIENILQEVNTIKNFVELNEQMSSAQRRTLINDVRGIKQEVTQLSNINDEISAIYALLEQGLTDNENISNKLNSIIDKIPDKEIVEDIQDKLGFLLTDINAVTPEILQSQLADVKAMIGETTAGLQQTTKEIMALKGLVIKELAVQRFLRAEEPAEPKVPPRPPPSELPSEPVSQTTTELPEYMPEYELLSEPVSEPEYLSEKKEEERPAPIAFGEIMRTRVSEPEIQKVRLAISNPKSDGWRLLNSAVKNEGLSLNTLSEFTAKYLKLMNRKNLTTDLAETIYNKFQKTIPAILEPENPEEQAKSIQLMPRGLATEPILPPSSQEEEEFYIEIPPARKEEGKGYINEPLSQKHIQSYMTGNGNKKIYMKRGKILGRGLNSREYIDIGKYKLNRNLLEKNRLEIKNQNNSFVSNLNNIIVSDDLVDILETLIDNNRINDKKVARLNTTEKKIFSRLINGSKIFGSGRIKLSLSDETKNKLKRFELVKGQYISGNDNEEVINELKQLLVSLSLEGHINRNEARDILLMLSI